MTTVIIMVHLIFRSITVLMRSGGFELQLADEKVVKKLKIMLQKLNYKLIISYHFIVALIFLTASGEKTLKKTSFAVE